MHSHWYNLLINREWQLLAQGVAWEHTWLNGLLGNGGYGPIMGSEVAYSYRNPKAWKLAVGEHNGSL